MSEVTAVSGLVRRRIGCNTAQAAAPSAHTIRIRSEADNKLVESGMSPDRPLTHLPLLTQQVTHRRPPTGHRSRLSHASPIAPLPEVAAGNDNDQGET